MKRTICRATTLAALYSLAALSTGATAAPVVMISIDGLRPDAVIEAREHGLSLPNLRRFVTEGAYAQGVVGVYPTITYAAHTTLVTGVNPSEHGILNNGAFNPLFETDKSNYWAQDIKVRTLWQVVSAAGLKTASVHWPATVGADGITFNIPQFHGQSTHSEIRLMEAISTPAGYLRHLEDEVGPFESHDTLQGDQLYERFAEQIIREQRPAFLTIHFSDLDHTQHDAGVFEAKGAKVMEELDRLTGALMSAALAVDPATTFVVVSDHGFADVDKILNLVVPLSRAGLIELSRPDKTGKRTVLDWQAAVYDADGSAAIYLKDPDDLAVLAKVREVLKSLQTPVYGVDRIIEGEAVKASGGFPGASFLVNMRPGFSLSASPNDSLITVSKGGAHGFFPDVPAMRSCFFVWGANLPVHGDLGVIDMKSIAPSVAGLLRVPFSQGGQSVLATNR